MLCKVCGAKNVREFPGEICLHLSGGLEVLYKTPVTIFPQPLVCLDCGFAEFSIPAPELSVAPSHGRSD
jgi:hypothetical protein